MSDLHKEKLRSAAQKHQKQRLAEEVDTAACILRPSLENHTSRVAFGGSSCQDNRSIVDEAGNILPIINVKRGSRSWDHKVSVNRGVASYVTAQADAISDFVKDTEQSKVMHVLSQNVFDDASMWMRDMAASEAAKHSEEDDGRRGKLQKGCNVHKPCCNTVETILVRRRGKVTRDDNVEETRSVLRCATVKSPCQPLPATANAAAVADRLFSWSALTARGSGDRLDPEHRIDLSGVPAVGILYTKDNLGLNDCIIGMEEQYLAARRADPWADKRLIGSFECLAHSACLGAKSAVSNRSELPKHLVKLGRLLESARTTENLLCEVDKEFDKRFRYRRCVALPPELAGFRREHRRILEVCRPCRYESKYILQEEEELLDGDNGCWDQWYIDHWCVRGECPMKCDGDEAKCKRRCKDNEDPPLRKRSTQKTLGAFHAFWWLSSSWACPN